MLSDAKLNWLVCVDLKAERVIFNISTYGALAVVGGILAFPAVTAVSQAYSNGALSSAPVSSLSLFDFLRHVVLDSDSGAMMGMGRGALVMLIGVASLLWLSVPRLRTEKGVFVGIGLSLLLLWGALSAYFSVCAYESMLDLCSYASSVSFFLLIAALSREFSLRRCLGGKSGGEVQQSAERTAKAAVSYLQLMTFAAIAGAWLLFLCNPVGDGLSGSFYNKNLLAVFLLLTLPVGIVRLFEHCREAEIHYISGLSASLVASIFCQISFITANISSLFLTYSRSCLILACFALSASFWLIVYLSKNSREAWRGAAWAALSCLLLIFSVFLFSRSFYVALVCLAASAVVVYRFFLSGVKGGKLMAALLCASAVLFSLVVLFVQSDSMAAKGSRHLQDLGAKGDTSLTSRCQFYEASLKITGEHPLLGVGAGNFERYYPLFQTDFRWFSKRSHSLSCDLLAEGGVLSFVLFYGLLAFVYVQTVKKVRSDAPLVAQLRLACALGAALLLIHAQLDIDSHVMVLPLWGAALLGLAWGIPSRDECLSNTLDECGLWSSGKRYFISYNCIPAAAVILVFCFSGQAWGGQYYSTIGKIYLDMDEPEKARQCYNWASEYDPNIGEYWRQMAALALNQCKSEDKAKSVAVSIRFCAMQAARLDPHRASVQSILGQGLELSDDLQGAEQCYKRALELDSKNSPDIYSNLARVYSKQGRLKEAKSVLDRAWSAFPEELLHQNYFFDFRYKLINNEMASCCLMRFEIAATEGNMAEAELSLSRACRFDSSLKNSLKDAAVYFLEQSKISAAAGQISKAEKEKAKAVCFLKVAASAMPQDDNIKGLLRLTER
ncbi:MAG: O-antigen ligase family protein [Candidatus Bruticola sp.]